MTATAEARRAYYRDYYDRFDRHVRGQRPLQDADAARARVRECVAAGMSHLAIAAAAGVSASTLNRIMASPDVRLREDVARRILTVTPRRPVTAIGITRRTRALAALGWTTTQIARRAGVNVDTVKRYRRGDTIEVHAGALPLVAAYDRLSMSTPPGTGRYDRAAASRARAEAAAGGWAPPLAWDDESIDDPTATPQGTGPDHTPVVETIRELQDMGLTLPAIAARLGIRENTVTAHLYRATRKDTAA